MFVTVSFIYCDRSIEGLCFMQCSNCGSELNAQAKFCPVCGIAVAQPPATASSGPAKPKSRTRKVAMVLFPVVLLTGIALFVAYLNPSVHPVIKNQPNVGGSSGYGEQSFAMTTLTAEERNGDLVFSLDALKKHRLIRFEHRGGKTPRWVMAYIAPNGQLVTAISISEHCGSTEFTIKDNKVFCARCPSNWDMMTMEAYACCAKYYPDPIPSRIVGDSVHVAKATVEQWAGRL